MKILIIGGTPKSLINFRGHFIQKLVQSGDSVTTMAALDSPEVIEIASQISDLGVKYCSFPVQRNGLNPKADPMSRPIFPFLSYI